MVSKLAQQVKGVEYGPGFGPVAIFTNDSMYTVWGIHCKYYLGIRICAHLMVSSIKS